MSIIRVLTWWARGLQLVRKAIELDVKYVATLWIVTDEEDAGAGWGDSLNEAIDRYFANSLLERARLFSLEERDADEQRRYLYFETHLMRYAESSSEAK